MKKFLYILLFPLIISGCVTELDIEVPEKPQKQVLNGLLSSDSTAKIYISTSRSVNSDQKIEIVKDASVQLYEDENYITDLQPSYYLRNYDTVWHYSAPYKLKAGYSYKIISHAGGLPEVYASAEIPEKVSFENLQLEQLTEEITFFDTLRTAIISFEIDDPMEENFYHLIVNDHSTRANIMYTTEEISASVTAGGSYVFNDIYFNGSRKKIIFTVELYNSKPILVIDFRNISEEYYNYQQTLSLQNITTNNPFTNPVESYSNVENGYGIIAGYNSHKALLPIK